MWTKNDAFAYTFNMIKLLEWGECEIDKKSFLWDPLYLATRSRILTGQPNMYWLCELTNVKAGEEIIQVNIDLKLKQNRKCIDRAYYTIYLNKEGGVDEVVQR